MNSEWIEGDLYFDFSNTIYAENFELSGKGHGLSDLLKAVDFIVEDNTEYYLIEVKNPENSKIPAKHLEEIRQKYLQRVKTGQINADLFIKLRDSLIFQSLNKGIPNKNMIYVVFIGLSSLDSAMLLAIKEDFIRHSRLLSGPKGKWKKGFHVLFLNFESWNAHLGKFKVKKI